MNLATQDPTINEIIKKENQRQDEHIELIASENFASVAVIEAQGSILTNKYAEGYPKNRYYGGCEFVDEIETLAIERLKQLFQVKYANVQPHSGSQANMAAFQALIKPGDKILGMSLNDGGHLTHGYSLSFSGQVYQAHFYGVNKATETIDYDQVLRIAQEVKPQLIIAGASSYSRIIDFAKFREIADQVGAYLVVDMAHIAGLVAAKLHPSPIPHAHIVTSTTHKTLRGPRGGIILTNDEDVAKKVNRAIFPGIQGGPLMHVVAAKAVAFAEALDPSFISYQKQVIKNARAMSDAFNELGYKVISGTTENHLLMINVKEKHQLTGLEAEKVLQKVYITCNKNSIPFDQERPLHGSGLRFGTPAVTTKGFKENEIKQVVKLIDLALSNRNDPAQLEKIKKQVLELTAKFVKYEKGATR